MGFPATTTDGESVRIVETTPGGDLIAEDGRVFVKSLQTLRVELKPQIRAAVDLDALQDVASEVGDVITEAKDVITEGGELANAVVTEALDVADAAVEVAAEAEDVAEAVQDVFDGTETEEATNANEDEAPEATPTA